MRTPKSKLVLPVLLAGTFMIVLDFFIVNVALPSMEVRLRAGSAAVEWVVAGYGLTYATFLMSAGRLGDRVGRRKVLCTGLALFALASAGCGLAPDITVLIVARLVQGAAAALIGPTVLALIGVLYPGAARTKAIGVYGTVLGVAAASGQLIGGLLIQADPAGLGWRSVFLINLPVAAAALFFIPRIVPESKAPGALRVDWAGTALVSLGLTALILPLLEGRQYGWPAWTILCLIASVMILGWFVAGQLRRGRSGRSVVLDMAMFKDRAFAAGLMTQLGLWCGQASFFLVLALYLQQGRGLDALQAGLVFTIMAGSYLVASLRAASLTLRFGRAVITAGALLLAAGHGLLLWAVVAGGAGRSVATLAPGLVLVGAGMGLCISPLVTIVMSASSPERAGAVSGAMSAVQQIGNSIGVAVTGIIFFAGLRRGYGSAFELSLVELGLLLVAVAALSRLLPPPARRAPQEMLARLHQLVGSCVSDVTVTSRSTVWIRLPGWDVAVTDVADVAATALQRAQQSGCTLTGAGRYGRLWWLSFSGRVFVLGSRLQIHPSSGPEAVTEPAEQYSPA
jgi:EmrB/QacA subfamily drug resistance transporter